MYYVTDRIQPDAAVAATITVRNDRPSSAQAVVRVHILDDQGKEVASGTSNANLNAGETQDVRAEASPIADPKLWDPDHPNRYVAVAEVADGSGTTDRAHTWIGLRILDWNDDGLLINGHPVKIRGLNRHQTQPFIGGAVPNRLQRRDALILKYGLGLNMVRSSHYPPDPEFLDECDRIGLLVMDEIPSWQFIGSSAEWQQNLVDAARDMILRDRNHPSVFLWGVRANEASPKESDDRELYAKTYALVHDLDPSRRPAGARLSDAWHGKMVPNEVLTSNDYSPLDKWPQPATTHPWLITEYGDAEQFPVWSGEGDLLRFARRWAQQMNATYAHSDIAGSVGWSAFDYPSPEFNTPWGVIAYHNVDDVYRLPKAFAGYVFESQKDPDLYGATVHILSYWRRSTPDLWVASNADEVEVRINGKSIGRERPNEYTSLPHPLFKFPLGDAFEKGTVEAIAYRNGQEVAKEQMRTPEATQALQLATDDPEILGDGADISKMVVYAVDANGTIVPYEDRRVNIEVQNGSLLGMSPVHLEGGRIAFYVQAREGERGPITVRVSADGLTSAEQEHHGTAGGGHRSAVWAVRPAEGRRIAIQSAEKIAFLRGTSQRIFTGESLIAYGDTSGSCLVFGANAGFHTNFCPLDQPFTKGFPMSLSAYKPHNPAKPLARGLFSFVVCVAVGMLTTVSLGPIRAFETGPGGAGKAPAQRSKHREAAGAARRVAAAAMEDARGRYGSRGSDRSRRFRLGSCQSSCGRAEDRLVVPGVGRGSQRSPRL